MGTGSLMISEPKRILNFASFGFGTRGLFHAAFKYVSIPGQGLLDQPLVGLILLGGNNFIAVIAQVNLGATCIDANPLFYGLFEPIHIEHKTIDPTPSQAFIHCFSYMTGYLDFVTFDFLIRLKTESLEAKLAGPDRKTLWPLL